MSRLAKLDKLRWLRSCLLVAILVMTTATNIACDRSDENPADETSDSSSAEAARRIAELPPLPRHETKHRVLLIGWDGATFRLIKPLLNAGRLPNLAALIERGVHGDLDSTKIPISSAAWSAVSTGNGPGKTGILGFFERIPKTYDVQLVTARSRRTPTLWQMLNAHGLKTIVWGIPLTFPVEQVDGAMVAGMLAPEESNFAYPPSLLKMLRDREFLPDVGKWRESREFSIDLVNEQLDIKANLLRKFVADKSWSLFMVNFKSLDVMSHRLYNGQPESQVADLCVRLDQVLGDLVRAAGEETDILLISDHGFYRYNKYLSINGWLTRFQYQTRKADEGDERDNADDDDHETGEDTGAPAGNGRNEANDQFREFRHATEIKRINMNKTIAFADVVEANYASVRLNMKGRDPEGIVKRADADRILDEMSRQMLEFRIQGRFGPLFVKTWKTKEIYPGPQCDNLPDLLVKLDIRYMAKPGFKQPVVGTQQGMPSHDDVGIFIAAGPSFGHKPDPVEGEILDIAPLVLHLLELPSHEEMDGRVPVQYLRAGVVVRRVSIKDDPAALRSVPRWMDEMNSDERKEIEDRLRDSNYFQ